MVKKQNKKIIFGSIASVILIIIIAISFFINNENINPEQNNLVLKSSLSGVPNPAATYCGALGYTISDGEGEGFCIFPDKSRCDEWDFYRGKCGQEWSYCTLVGYDLKNLSNLEGWGADGSICIDKNTKEEIGNVYELINQEWNNQINKILTSSAGVSYDSNITDFFVNSEWVPVIIDIKDTTNISISYTTDSKEIQEAKDNEKNRILSDITDSVLGTLSKDEFKLKSKYGYTFSGEITKEGFDKLINDSRIETIFFNGISYLLIVSKIRSIFVIIIPIILFIVIVYFTIRRRKIKKIIKKS